MIDTGCAVDSGLDQVGNTGIDDFRCATGQYRGNRNHWKFNRGITVNTDVLVADDSEQYQYGGEHIGEYMSPDSNFRQVQFTDSATFILAPSVRNAAPSVATVSPPLSPDKISTRPASR